MEEESESRLFLAADESSEAESTPYSDLLRHFKQEVRIKTNIIFFLRFIYNVTIVPIMYAKTLGENATEFQKESF